jgi:ABC-type uncharacterized transport system substrate-binding protein
MNGDQVSGVRFQQESESKTVKKKFSCLALGAMLFALWTSAGAQQLPKIPRVGFVTASGPEGPNIALFRQGLRELGYIEGKNILIEYRYAEGMEDRLPGLVAELVQLNVDMLVVTPARAIHAAKHATKTIPIVMVTTADPVATGLVVSLARPGGNVTGVTRLTRELSGKRLELLKETIPKLSRIGLLLDGDAPGFRDYEIAASALNLQLQSLKIRSPNPDFEGAFQAAAKGRVSAIVTVSSGLTLGYRNRIAELAISNRLASMHERNEFVEAGGLMSYSSIDSESFRRAAIYVDKILKGAKPADLPVEQPMKFELVINLKTAKQIGLTIPPNVLARADRVIR